MFFEVQLDIAIPNRQGVNVKRSAGDVIPESEIAPGSLDSCLRLRQLVQCPAPVVDPKPDPKPEAEQPAARPKK